LITATPNTEENEVEYLDNLSGKMESRSLMELMLDAERLMPAKLSGVFARLGVKIAATNQNWFHLKTS